MSDFIGLACGIVKEIDDELGRVRVNLPWLPGENKTYWARIAAPMAGSGRGAWFLPELEDEVLLGFEMGKIDHPYVLGFLWSQTDKPPVSDSSIDGKVRRFRSVKQHRLDFDDRDDSEKVLLQSSKEHALELEDSKKFVELRSGGERSVRLDDDKKTITIKTAADPVIEMKEQTPKSPSRSDRAIPRWSSTVRPATSPSPSDRTPSPSIRPASPSRPPAISPSKEAWSRSRRTVR